MPDLSIFKLDTQTINIKDTTAREAADSAKTLATTASGNATTALNKINELESEKADAIISSASGAIASFQDGAEAPVKSLTVGIEPVQDLHGYDSPWPAGGGKNLCALNDFTVTKRGVTFTYTNGELTVNGTPADTGWFSVGERFSLPAGSYTASYQVSGSNPVIRVGFNNFGGYAQFNSSGTQSRTFTLSEEKSGVFDVYCGQLTAYANTKVLIQVEAGSSATAWTPYSNICPISGWTGSNVTVSPTTDAEDGHTYPITFPSEAGTVYGGSLTVNEDGTGKLVVDRAKVTYDGDGSEHWMVYTQFEGYLIFESALKNGVRQNGFSNMLKDSKTATTGQKNCMWLGVNTQYVYVIGVYETMGSTVDDFRNYLAENNLEIVCPLATPITYTLTDVEVLELLKGVNNVWADTGDTSVTYRADTKLYIDKKFTDLQALILEN